MVFLIVRIEGIEGTAKPLIGLLTLLGLPRLVCLPGLVGFVALLCLLALPVVVYCRTYMKVRKQCQK